MKSNFSSLVTDIYIYTIKKKIHKNFKALQPKIKLYTNSFMMISWCVKSMLRLKAEDSPPL